MSFLMSTSRRKKILVCTVVLAGLAVIGVLLRPIVLRAAASEYKTSLSPDGKYKIVVYRLPDFSFRMPGQSGDAPGYVRLYDSSGRMLAEKDVDMVQAADRISWEKKRVSIWLVAEWNLPE